MSRRAHLIGLFSVAGIGVLLFNVYPMVWLLAGSLRQSGGSFTLAYYREIFTVFTHLEALKNTFVLALGAIPLALLMGIVAALSASRVVTPLSRWIRTASTIAFVSPPWVTAIAYALLLSPNAGIANRWVNSVLGFKPFNAFSMGTMVFVTALFLYPYVFLILTSALDNMDSSYEEAAITVGCSPVQTLVTITLPLITPALITSALFSLVYVWGLYSLPAILGVPAKIYVFATYLWFLLNGLPPKLELSAAMATFFAAVSTVLFWAAFWLSRSYGLRFQVVGGKGHRSVRLQAPQLGGPLVVVNGILVALALVIPYAVLIIMSASRNPYRPLSLANFTLAHYVAQLTESNFLRVVGNTLQLALYVAVAASILSFVVAYLDLRSRSRLAEWLSAGAMFPIVVPGVAFVVGTAWAWLRPPVVLYGTLAVIAMNQVARYLPLGVTNVRDGLGQLHPSLEEAALTCGASITTTIYRIALPLIKPTVLSTFLLLLMSSMRDLLSPLFLGDGSARTATLATTTFFLWDEGLVARSAALCVILAIITLCMYYPLQRILIRAPAGGGPGG